MRMIKILLNIVFILFMIVGAAVIIPIAFVMWQIVGFIVASIICSMCIIYYIEYIWKK